MRGQSSLGVYEPYVDVQLIHYAENLMPGYCMFAWERTKPQVLLFRSLTL